MKRAFRVMPVLILALCPALATAQQITVGGQIRPRSEYRDPSLSGAGTTGREFFNSGDGFTSMRSRVHVDAELKGNVRIFAQLQDVRLWGSEGSTLTDFNADNFDLHQGFVDLSSEDDVWLGRAGRQEVNLGGQRLIGAVDWTQQARSFDGLRLQRMKDGTGATFLAFQTADATAPSQSTDAGVFAGYGKINNLLGGALGLYGIYNTRNGSLPVDLGTFGFRQVGKIDQFNYSLESYYQTGNTAGLDVQAFMVGARIGMNLGKGTVTLWYDYLSGDDDLSDNTIKVFNTLFATNHKFYGYADLFLVIPVETGGRGLQDVAIKGTYKPSKSTLLKLNLHSFRAAKQGSLSTNRFGEEIDLVGSWRYNEHLAFTGGAAYVIHGDALAELGRLDQDMTWLYLMVDASF